MFQKNLKYVLMHEILVYFNVDQVKVLHGFVMDWEVEEIATVLSKEIYFHFLMLLCCCSSGLRIQTFSR